MRSLALLTAMLFTVSGFVRGAEDFQYAKVNQGDWAVLMVRALNLDAGKELLKYEDFTNLLTSKNIAPREGWKPDQKLTYESFAGTLGLALLHLNKDGKKQGAEFNKFLGFLQTKMRIDIAQLLSIIPAGESYLNLREGIAGYLAENGGGETASEVNPQGTAAAANSPASKANDRISSNPILAAVISDMSQVLTILDAGPSDPDYWSIFAEPASPILPNQTFTP